MLKSPRTNQAARSASLKAMGPRSGFTTRLGFILAAAGSAVGLGNIWGFPTQAANHGGGAFIIVYLIVMVLLAFPALYAEILIGYRQQANPVTAMRKSFKPLPFMGNLTGYGQVIGAFMMLGFYSILAGWMFAHASAALFDILTLTSLSSYTKHASIGRDLLFSLLVIVMTAAILFAGVAKGIETWSKRLMPALLIMMLGLIIYILTLPGAGEGLQRFFSIDYSALTNPNIILAAMGQAFFSLSVGVGGMMVYGSYLKPPAKPANLAFSIASLDTAIALLAGMLIIPAMYVALFYGSDIAVNGQLLGQSQLIFQLLPALFDSLGSTGQVLSLVFFSLLSIASLTSTIASSEVPVSYLKEVVGLQRQQAVLIVAAIVILISGVVVWHFDLLFRPIITILMHFMLPIMGLIYFIVVGWLMPQTNPTKQLSWVACLIKWHLRLVCPALMITIFLHSAF